MDGKRLVVPVSHPHGRMEIRVVKAMSELNVKDRYGITIPGDNALTASEDDIDFAVIPGVCFSRECARLGRGGGYYDRFLESYKGFSAGLCRSHFLTKHIPEESHDRRVSAVVTDVGIFYL